jgi:hypothetical protein
MTATGSISQFELRLYDRPGETGTERSGSTNSFGTSESEFDSLWPNL